MMAPENVSPGVRVRLKGLASRPKLNGSVAVVLSPSSEKEAENLSSQGRIKVTGFPVALSVKRNNVVPMFHNRVDWTFSDTRPPLSILDIVQGHLSDIDRCNDLEDAVYDAISQGAPKAPRVWLPHAVSAILNNCSPHCVYFLALDQIGHHFILETHQGLARMYQSYVKDRITLGETDIVIKVTGYTAGEWVAKKLNAACPKMAAAHQRLGGGKVLDYSSLREIVDLLVELQECASQIAEAMVVTAPKDLQAAQAKFEKSFAAGTQANAKSPVALWSEKLIRTPWAAGLISNEIAGDTIIDNPSATEPFHFVIQPALAQKFHRLHAQLTGQEVSAGVYLKILNFYKCERLKEIHEATGMLSAVGWSVIPAQIPH